MKALLIAAVVAATAQVQAQAEGTQIELDKLYIGGNLTHNVIDSPFGGSSLDANGVSVFAGYAFANDIPQVNTYAELGYSQTDDFFADSDIRGIWAAAVAEKALPEVDPRLSALARFGIDFGDDDGMFIGAGAGFRASDALSLRAEFINKDASTVYQLGAVVHF